MNLHTALAEHGLVAILRARSAGPLLDVLRILVDAGVRALEVTVPTPGGLDAVRVAAAEFGPDVWVGAGTVLTEADVAATAAAGGRFVVSPSVDPAVIAAATAAGLGSLPGAYTPTEIVAAWRCGPTAVKLFPATGLGPRYVADVRAPLPEIPLVPTGGVGLAEVGEYRAAGALAVGVGSPLQGDALTGGSPAALAERAKQFVAEAAR